MKILDLLSKIYIIFPKHCPICESSMNYGGLVCRTCQSKMTEYNKKRKCLQCGRENDISVDAICKTCEKLKPEFDLANSVYRYEKEFQKAMLNLKFHSAYYKVKAFSALMCDAYIKLGVSTDYVAAVPSTLKGLIKRGYNPPLEMALPMGRKLKIPVLTGALLKIRPIKQQSLMSGEERYRNVKGAYAVNKRYIKKIKGKSILLIDDVITTGATSSECAKMLKKAGAEAVYVITFLAS